MHWFSGSFFSFRIQIHLYLSSLNIELVFQYPNINSHHSITLLIPTKIHWCKEIHKASYYSKSKFHLPINKYWTNDKNDYNGAQYHGENSVSWKSYRDISNFNERKYYTFQESNNSVHQKKCTQNYVNIIIRKKTCTLYLSVDLILIIKLCKIFFSSLRLHISVALVIRVMYLNILFF